MWGGRRDDRSSLRLLSAAPLLVLELSLLLVRISLSPPPAMTVSGVTDGGSDRGAPTHQDTRTEGRGEESGLHY